MAGSSQATRLSPSDKELHDSCDAQAWTRDQERSIDRAELPTNQTELKTITLWDLLDRYEREITPAKRGADRERSELLLVLRTPS